MVLISIVFFVKKITKELYYFIFLLPMSKHTDGLIKTDKEIANIRASGKHLTELLHIVYAKAKAGIKLIELEFVAEHYIQQHNLK